MLLSDASATTRLRRLLHELGVGVVAPGAGSLWCAWTQ